VETEAPTPTIISAADLHSEYYENELAADKLYKGNELQVTGVFDRLSITLGQIQVWVSDGEEWSLVSICCNFDDESSDQVESLKTGDPVSIKGVCLGKSVSVGLDHCILIND
jgi:hypothetical protein